MVCLRVRTHVLDVDPDLISGLNQSVLHLDHGWLVVPLVTDHHMRYIFCCLWNRTIQCYAFRHMYVFEHFCLCIFHNNYLGMLFGQTANFGCNAFLCVLYLTYVYTGCFYLYICFYKSLIIHFD